MKIIQLVTKLELGGAQINTLISCKHLLAAGHKVILASSPGPLLASARAVPGLKTVLVPGLVREISPLNDLTALCYLACLYYRERPDIVHTHSSKAGILGRLAAAVAGVPAIHTIHGFGITPLQPLIIRTAFQYLERICALVSKRLIAVGRENVETGLEYGIGYRRLYSVIRSGIEFGYIPSKEPLPGLENVPENVPVVGTVSCLKPQKNPIMFVEIAARIPEAVFVLIGDGDLAGELRKKVREYGLGDRFIHIGWSSRARDYLYRFNCFLLPSLWEGLPRSLLESIDAGLPMVASDVDGNREVIADQKTGFLVHPDDLDGFVKAVKRVLADETVFREAVEEFCDESFVREFSADTMGNRVVDLIERVGKGGD